MCLQIYIGSEKQLPTIPWNEEAPGLSILELSDDGYLEMVKPILQSNFYYDVGSFMGCTCGLMYGEWLKDDKNYEQRVQNATDFLNYLRQHSLNNTLKVFGTYWNVFPETYPIESFVVDGTIPEEFDLQEEVIFLIHEWIRQHENHLFYLN